MILGNDSTIAVKPRRDRAEVREGVRAEARAARAWASDSLPSRAADPAVRTARTVEAATEGNRAATKTTSECRMSFALPTRRTSR